MLNLVAAWRRLVYGQREHDELIRSLQVVDEDRRVQELVAGGASIVDVLETLTRSIERIATDCHCTILLLDYDHRHLIKGAGPSLPAAYMDALSGLEIGPDVGACGSAAYRNETVIVEDVATDYRFGPRDRDFVLSYGLRAAWSVPIRDSGGAVLGTFAMYHRWPAKPHDSELRLVEAAAHIAGSAVERLRDRQRLTDIAGRLALAEQAAAFGIWEIDIPGRVVSLSAGLASLLAWSSAPDRIAIDALSGMLHDDDRERFAAAVADACTSGQLHAEFRVRLADGTIRWLRGQGRVEFENGVPTRGVGALTDVTESRHLVGQLQEARVLAEMATLAARKAEGVEQDRRNFLELVTRGEPLDGVLSALARVVTLHLPPGAACSIQLDVSDGSRVAASSNALDELVGVLGQVPLTRIRQTLAAEPFANIAFESVPIVRQGRTIGTILALLAHGTAMSSAEHQLLESWGQFASLAVERSLLFEDLSHRADHDDLTGLLNRSSLCDRLAAEILRANRADTALTVLYLDLDRFKEINDTHGHGAGDEVLREVSRRILGSIRLGDVAARIGGDEFVVVLPGVGEVAEAARIGDLITQAVVQPIFFNGGVLHSKASLGLSVFPGDGTCPEELLAVADNAMYRAKHRRLSSAA
jgi:diguanylate cyclase (GGDEF)-like protein